MNARAASRTHRLARPLAAGLVALLVTACADVGEELPTAVPFSPDQPALMDAAGEQDFGPAIRAADRHTAALMKNPNIVGTGVGLNQEGRPSVRLFLVSEHVNDLPEHLDGVPVSTAVTGTIWARADRTARARPAPIGFSVGHPNITAGTLGARVTKGSQVFILSNNHVLANSNDGDIGDSALQPGSFDGGSDPVDAIGTLYDYYEIVFGSGGNNEMDAAIALVDGADVSGSTPDGAGYGAPGTNPKNATVGMKVQKYGRTTGHTSGEVAEINVTVSVCFAGFIFCTKSATFVNQISITPGSFSDGGDSGSLIVENASGNAPVGLLFAGSSTRTIANRIGVVLDHFGVSIDPTVPDGDPTEPDPTGPTASFTSDCTELSCGFDASGSTAGDAAIASYDWDFGDGNTGSGQTVSHTYASAGAYTVTLTVTDTDGLDDTDSQDVSVSTDDGEVTADPVIESFEVSTRTTGPWNRATVQWAVSHEDGALVSVISELLDSGGGVLDSQTSSVSGSSASGEHELRTRSTPTQVRLTVTDSEGNTASETKNY
jgi:PKD repeat protein